MEVFLGQITSLVAKKFQTHWFKIPLLGETEITIRLDIKSQWGLLQVIPFWVCCFFVTAVNDKNSSITTSRSTTDCTGDVRGVPYTSVRSRVYYLDLSKFSL